MALRERELVGDRAHLFCQHRDPLGVAEAYRDETLGPDRDAFRYRLTTLTRTGARLLEALARPVDEPEVHQLDRKLTEQGHARIGDEDPLRGVGQRVARGEAAFQPLPSGARMPAQELDLAMYGARGDQQCGIIRLLRQRLDPLR